MSTIQEQDIAMNTEAEPVVKENKNSKGGKNETELIVSQSAEQQEERLRKRRIRDRTRQAAQTIEQRQLCLQRRCDRVSSESSRARLQDMTECQRDRLAT